MIMDDLAIRLENRSGTLAAMAEALGVAGISDHDGRLILVVDDPEAAPG